MKYTFKVQTVWRKGTCSQCKQTYEYELEPEWNGPVTLGQEYEIEGESVTHYQHRNNNGMLVWNNKKFFKRE